MLSLVRGKIKKCGSISLDEHSVIDEMENTDVYKYLGVLESDNIKHNEMKTITLEKFKKKLKTILKTDLNAKNNMIAINEFVNPVLTYTYGIVNWTEQDIKSADILVRKMLHMNRMFEIWSDVDRLYIPRNNGGRGLVSLWDSFKTTNARLAHFLTNSPSQIITKCSELDKTGQFSINKKAYKFHEKTPIELPKNFHDNSLLKQAKIVAEKTKNAIQKQRYEACLNKPHYGVFFKLLDESQISRGWSMSWLNNCHMAPQTESFIFAAQELALFTKWHERFILKKQVSDLCRVCMKKSETMSHIPIYYLVVTP